MKYLIIGSGGREHALFWRLMNDGSSSEVYCAPGNGGIPDKFLVNLDSNDFSSIENFCCEKKIDMAVIGPEAPLAAGLSDYLADKKIPVFGPSKKAAMLESSKIFAKEIMTKYGVPTAGHEEFTSKDALIQYMKSAGYPAVIKLDGLAAGKGVAIPENFEEALAFINENVADGARVFAEEYLEGEEASVLGLCDGETVKPFIAAQDHKRIFDGDRGPNTGGMGAYSPAPLCDAEMLKIVTDTVLLPVVRGMKSEGSPFKGILYAGLMIKEGRIKVLEFNVRFGDPEAQALLPLLNVKLGDLFQASAAGRLSDQPLTFSDRHALTVVISSGGYPGPYEKGKLISGLDSMPEDVTVFHAGTRAENGKIYTAGGRVLNVTATGSTLKEAREKVYANIDRISFDGAFYRKDIAHRALGR